MNQNWGTGNIKDTQVELIKSQVNNFISDIQNNVIGVNFQEKYNILYKTSKSLFDLIIKDASKTNFNRALFDEKLDKMLYYIEKIQQSGVTQDLASQKVGEMLASEYIPQCKK
jgi:hypothetical protein